MNGHRNVKGEKSIIRKHNCTCRCQTRTSQAFFSADGPRRTMPSLNSSVIDTAVTYMGMKDASGSETRIGVKISVKPVLRRKTGSPTDVAFLASEAFLCPSLFSTTFSQEL